jgi:hypothetical protein
MTVVLKWGIEGSHFFHIEAPSVEDVIAIHEHLAAPEISAEPPCAIKINPDDGTYAPTTMFIPEGVWFVWGGGKCPVRGDAMVCAILRDGRKNSSIARNFEWDHAGNGGDILCYKVVAR